jgi:hypothetical protein
MDLFGGVDAWAVSMPGERSGLGVACGFGGSFIIHTV